MKKVNRKGKIYVTPEGRRVRYDAMTMVELREAYQRHHRRQLIEEKWMRDIMEEVLRRTP